MGFANKYPYTDFHEINLDWLLGKVKELNSSVEEIKALMEKIVTMTPEQIQKLINDSITIYDRDLKQFLNTMRIDITTDYKAYCDSAIRQLTIYIDNRDAYYDAYARGYAAAALYEAKTYAEERLSTYAYMFSPITGRYEDVRNVVEEIIAYYHGDNILTASEYDAKDLTASAYDALQLSATDYDLNGKNLIT